MDTVDKEINNIIMQEIGLEIGPRERIYDQDTGMAIQFNGMDIVAPGCFGGKQAVEFDPHNNRKMMSQLFGYFLDKHSEETGIDAVTYYNKDSGNVSSVEVKLSDDSVVTSQAYLRDSLKYTDIIMQLNGEESVDLKRFDVPFEKKTVKPQRAKRSK